MSDGTPILSLAADVPLPADALIVARTGANKQVTAQALQQLGNAIQTPVPSSLGTQAAATLLGYGTNVILSGPTGPGWSVKLPSATGSGKLVEVLSRAGWFVVIYPSLGEAISFFSANIAYAIYPATYLTFRDTAVGQWDLVYNLASIFPIMVGLTAHAGGGQASATQLGYGVSVVSTCATDSDSVKMPIALGAGEFIGVVNKGAKQLAVYPASGDNFQGYAANAPMYVAPGKSALFLDEGPPNEWAGATMGMGYSMPFLTVSSLSAPADATTYFVGIGIGPATSEGIQKIRIPRAGRVTRVDLSILTLGSVGSAELSSIYFRLNSATDTLLTAAVNESGVYQEFNVVTSIPVKSGDFFEIKWVTPTWVTNPTGVIINGCVFVE